MATNSNYRIYYAISIAWQLGFIIVVPIGGFLFLGFLADKFFSVQPLFLLIGLLVGFFITVHEVRNMLIPLIKDQKENA